MSVVSEKYLFEGRLLGYIQIHEIMKKRIPKPNKCPICNERKTLELTNIYHTYTECPLEWCWKCTSCHKIFDITEETRKKLSNSLKGRVFTKEHISNLTKSHKGMSGKKHSEESILKMSKSRKGVKQPPFTEEHKLNISKAQKILVKNRKRDNKGRFV